MTPWPGFIPYTDRTDYLAAMFANQGYVMAAERLLGLEVPPRAEYLRVLACELNRIASHLVAFGTFTADMSEFLETCVKARRNILISGGTGSGDGSSGGGGGGEVARHRRGADLGDDPEVCPSGAAEPVWMSLPGRLRASGRHTSRSLAGTLVLLLGAGLAGRAEAALPPGVGVLLLLVGTVGLLTPLIGHAGVIGLLALMGLAGAVLGATLPDTE